MKQYKIDFTSLFSFILVISIVGVFSSCNKSLPEAEAIPKPQLNPGATQTIGDFISKDASYSIYLAAVQRAGVLAKLSDPKAELTVFAPKNDAFILSGIPSAAVIGAMPIQTVAAIAAYSIIPGRQYLSSQISETFPNVQLPSSLKIGDLPGTPLPLQMSLFPSRQNGFWINDIPIVATDQKFTNGVIHNPYAVVAPPAQVMRDMIYNDPDLTYFKAGVARADSGQTGTASFDFLLGYAVTNMTLLVPNNDAMKELLFGSIYSGLLQQGMDPAQAYPTANSLVSTPDVFSNPALFPILTAATVRGLLAYHFLAEDKGAGYQPSFRTFGNNFAKTPTFYKTMVNSSVGVHPGILVNVTYTGPVPSGITFTGMGTFPPGGPAFSGTPANAVSLGNYGVNGNYYVIDKVLLPQ